MIDPVIWLQRALDVIDSEHLSDPQTDDDASYDRALVDARKAVKTLQAEALTEALPATIEETHRTLRTDYLALLGNFDYERQNHEVTAIRIVDIGVALGITKGDTPLTWPHILLLADECIKEVQRRSQPSTCVAEELEKW